MPVVLTPDPALWMPPADAMQVLQMIEAEASKHRAYVDLLDRLATARCPGWVVLLRDGVEWSCTQLYGAPDGCPADVAEVINRGWSSEGSYPLAQRAPGTTFLPAEPAVVMGACFHHEYIQLSTVFHGPDGAGVSMKLDDRVIAATSHSMHAAIFRLWAGLVRANETRVQVRDNLVRNTLVRTTGEA